MRSDLRTYWRDSGYWQWLWRERVSGQTKGSIAVIVALAFGVAGYLSADRLAATEDAATFTTQRVVTVVRKTRANTPPEVVTTTTTQPGKTDVVTVRRDGRTVVVRAPGETVTEALTVRGAVQERVVTDTRVRTVTPPGITETVTQEVTEPARTVTEPARTVTDTVTEKVTVTEEVTVTTTTTVKPGPPDD